MINDNASPLVSVAMATYNGSKYLEDQLLSILGQTYRNIEIVITDDGSTDNTVSVIEMLQQKYSCIRLYRNEKNSGINKTFQRAILESKGEFIALSDQDDIWDLKKIEILLNGIGKENAVYSDSELVDKNGDSMHKLFSEMMNLTSYYSAAPFLIGNCIPGHTIMMRADFAKKIMPIPEEIMFDRWISFCASGNEGIRFIDMPLVKYRQHETNTIGTGKSKHKKTAEQKFKIKLAELERMVDAPIKDQKTKGILAGMISLFNHKWSIRRSVFFFKNMENILVIKKKAPYRKVLYCLKMIFKANY